MTTKLKSLFQKASVLSPKQQDFLAEMWLAELQDEKLWDDNFARSRELIDSMAEQAIKNHRAGKSIAKGWDEI